MHLLKVTCYFIMNYMHSMITPNGPLTGPGMSGKYSDSSSEDKIKTISL